jgi:hypothetical protein
MTGCAARTTLAIKGRHSPRACKHCCVESARAFELHCCTLHYTATDDVMALCATASAAAAAAATHFRNHVA